MENRLTAQELQQISDFAVSLMQTNPEMKKLIFRLLGEVTQSREQVIGQFLDSICVDKPERKGIKILVDMAHHGD